MCHIISSAPCRCAAPARGSLIPGPLAALAATLRAAWWLLAHVVAPAVAVAVWWLSGGHVLRSRPRRYHRGVHAAGRILAALAAVATLAWPVTTGLALLAVGVALAATVGTTRHRRRRPASSTALPPRRVRAWVGTVRPITHTAPAADRPTTDRTGVRA